MSCVWSGVDWPESYLLNHVSSFFSPQAHKMLLRLYQRRSDSLSSAEDATFCSLAFTSQDAALHPKATHPSFQDKSHMTPVDARYFSLGCVLLPGLNGICMPSTSTVLANFPSTLHHLPRIVFAKIQKSSIYPIANTSFASASFSHTITFDHF